MKKGYASQKRAELLKKLKPAFGKIKNISTGIEANLSKKSLDKMTSAKALEKSKSNGFSFVAPAILQIGKKADVLITVKESVANGHKIYSIELDEINKASERFQGLSDAAKTADRATKTPHVDSSIIAQSEKKSSAGGQNGQHTEH